ncbi:hypothetical protein GMORB2_5737 [Geosmithia morbida]|uniref:RNA polymerase II holoenzyme cyclin-like subunit n=1 Tax=Geosmithia morbida TaxID=1094350 RepID=A0A9P5D4Y6_9HYPO|nr:uncharacterized protein GMORB2_5737 [Geosmithia morbida]KAF4124021.1 hypothetical protein GMORB2_5737 [Geosmithia morbida]
MASIDRYRPPREGYQPPVPANRQTQSQERPRSPSPSNSQRQPHLLPQQDVPPAAPTPPQHSARTSPPRAHGAAAHPVTATSSAAAGGGQSPAPSGAQTPPALLNQWSFSTEEVNSTPTILEGVAPSEERMRRAKGVNFIYQAGVMLDLPQITLWVAGVFFHRFYMRWSMHEKTGIHHYNIAATALFLANKVEENCRKTKDIIIAVAKVAQKNAKLIIDEQSKEYWRWRDSILTYEEIMLEQLTFDLMIDNPYRHLFELLEQLDLVHNKHLRQAAWAFCNDACLTALPLLVEARDVALTAIFFASVHTGQRIDDVNGQPWWRYLKGNEARCAKAIDVIRQFYTENPLRKQNPSLPSPAFDLEISRRRAEAIISQPDSDAPAPATTPMDIDRRTRSRSPLPPRPDGGGLTAAAAAASSSQPQQPPRSPAKRKEAEGPAEGDDHSRADKRPRLSDEEEGEEGELVEG